MRAATTPPEAGQATGQFPRRGSHPSKTFPHQQPFPHHCEPLPSCRYRPARPGHRLTPTPLPTAHHRGGERTPVLARLRISVLPAPRGAASVDPSDGSGRRPAQHSEERRYLPRGAVLHCRDSFPRLRRARSRTGELILIRPVSLLAVGAPKSFECELRGTGFLLRRGGYPCPGGPSARCCKQRRLPCPGGRGTRSLERVDGRARKRSRFDDAPIRRSGPPRHRGRRPQPPRWLALSS
jgi:hypothetical protein